MTDNDEAMVDRICNHDWRAVTATKGTYSKWNILEQCSKCNEYRQNNIKATVYKRNGSVKETSDRDFFTS